MKKPLQNLYSFFRALIWSEWSSVREAPSDGSRAAYRVEREKERMAEFDEASQTLNTAIQKNTGSETEQVQKERAMCELTRIILLAITSLLRLFRSKDSPELAERALKLFKDAQAACRDWPEEQKDYRVYKHNIRERIEDLNKLLSRHRAETSSESGVATTGLSEPRPA